MSSKGHPHKILYVFLVSRILATSSVDRSVFYFAIITMATVWVEILHQMKQKQHNFSLRSFIKDIT
jgi:hypothetical protein